MRLRALNHQGFNLIEIIISIVILVIVLPTSYVAFSGMMKNVAKPEYVIDARYAAEIAMERLTRINFANIVDCKDESCTNYAYHDMNADGTYPEYAGFQWKCTIIPASFNAGANTVNDDLNSSTLKRVSVDVKMPDGNVYSAHTLVTKKPADGG